MRERSKEILFAHFIAFGEQGRKKDARGEFKANPVTRAEALESATADLTKNIKRAMLDAACLIMARGHGDGPGRNDKPARHLFDLLCEAEEAILGESAASQSVPTVTLSRRKISQKIST